MNDLHEIRIFIIRTYYSIRQLNLIPGIFLRALYIRYVLLYFSIFFIFFIIPIYSVEGNPQQWYIYNKRDRLFILSYSCTYLGFQILRNY